MAYINKRLGTDSFPGRLNEARTQTTAGGGTSLGTVVTVSSVIALANKTTHVTLYPRNFTGANVLKFSLNPFLEILVTSNGLQSVTDYSQIGQQNPADATGVVLNGATGAALYIGSHVPFRGVAVTNVNANTNASVLTVNFWNGSAWTAVSGFTDGTTAGGNTMSQNGLVTWTVPSTWAKTLLSDAIPGISSSISGWGTVPGQSQPVIPVAPIQKATLLPYNEKPRFWAQWNFSAALSANVSNSPMLSLNRSTQYAEIEAKVFMQLRTFHGPDGIAAIEAILDAGTGNLIVTAYNDSENGSF